MEVGYFSGSNCGTALWDESLSPKKFMRSVSIVHHPHIIHFSHLFTCCALRQLHGAIGSQSSGRCCDARRGGASTGAETQRVGLLNPDFEQLWFVICVVIHVIHVIINPVFFGALCMFERLWLLYPWVPYHFCFPWRRNSVFHFRSEIASLRRNLRRCWEWQMMALTMKQRKSWSKAGKFAVWPSMLGIRILQQLWKQPRVLRLKYHSWLFIASLVWMKLYGKNYIWLTESQRAQRRMCMGLFLQLHTTTIAIHNIRWRRKFPKIVNI